MDFLAETKDDSAFCDNCGGEVHVDDIQVIDKFDILVCTDCAYTINTDIEFGTYLEQARSDYYGTR